MKWHDPVREGQIAIESIRRYMAALLVSGKSGLRLLAHAPAQGRPVQ